MGVIEVSSLTLTSKSSQPAYYAYKKLERQALNDFKAGNENLKSIDESVNYKRSFFRKNRIKRRKVSQNAL